MTAKVNKNINQKNQNRLNRDRFCKSFAFLEKQIIFNIIVKK